MKRIVLAGGMVAIVAALAWTISGGRGPVEPRGISVTEALGAVPADGFARALGPRSFVFPRDHGPHPEFRTEWWYWTGNLCEFRSARGARRPPLASPCHADGRRFGFQLTFFRIALAPDTPRRESAWGARDAWMAHFAVTDVAGGRFVWHTRLARGAVGLAGAVPSPFRVWLEDWSAAAVAVRSRSAGSARGERDTVAVRSRSAGSARGERDTVAVRSRSAGSARGERDTVDPNAAMPPVRLVAAADEVAIDLTLETAKPVVLHGDIGFSVKGREPGNASHYYSLTRLRARGEVRIGGARVDVRGLAWMDREWSTSALGRDQVGWDWFALQLEDGRDVMVYRLRRADGSIDPASAGTVVAADGTARALHAADVKVETLAWWSSPRDGTRYPARWRVTIPREGLVLDVEPRLADQELGDPIRYWEGAVAVRGRDDRSAVRGDGYVELVGYARAGSGRGAATMGR